MSRPSALDNQMAAEARRQRIRSAIAGGTSFIICMTVLLTVSWWTLSILAEGSPAAWDPGMRIWFMLMAGLSILPATSPLYAAEQLCSLAVTYLVFVFIRWQWEPTGFLPFFWTAYLGWGCCEIIERG